MSSLNNLEKLIQIATIEQMYSMLQKMKNDFPNEVSDIVHSTTTSSTTTNNTTTSDIVTKLQMLLNENTNKTDHSLILINRLVEKINSLERELANIKHESELNNTTIKQLETHIKGQQKLTDYAGFKKLSRNVEAEQQHIILKIEEKHVDAFPRKTEEVNLVSDEDVSEEGDDEEPEQNVTVVEDAVEDELEEEEEEELEEEEKEQEAEEEESEAEEEEEESEEEEEESEEEVATDDETHEEVVNVTPSLETVSKEREKEREKEHKEEEEEEEEEVFEIEIDDVTYFATSDENGILYEVTEDGEVGNKVGIIKDGEPIFS
jgi:septal ring factor EnvC (AmiA/AmiB activator)